MNRSGALLIAAMRRCASLHSRITAAILRASPLARSGSLPVLSMPLLCGVPHRSDSGSPDPEPERIAGRPADFPEPLLAALRAAVARGARVLSVCTGAFVLGAAGLLDDRRCTAHWRHTAQLAQLFPAAKVDPAVLYVDEDPVITSAGTGAGIDAFLHLVRRDQGSRVATGIARRMVVPPHRDGGQAQYAERPLTELTAGTMQDVLNWMTAHLAEPVTVDALAARAFMSPRTFARRFVQETGTTPQRWLTGQRILLAQQLLEETDESVDEVAAQAGFGTAEALRHHFRTTPLAYRRVFRDRSVTAGRGGDGAARSADVRGSGRDQAFRGQ